MPAFSQTLRIALRQDLDVLDPTLATTYVGRIVFAGLCDKLFDIDEKLNIVPQLATGYEWADDRTLVIHLRSGVKFQNGEVLDAAAVKYSLERHLTMQGSFRKSEISSIDHVEVVDPATVRIVLKVPSGAFLAQLTDRSGMIYAAQGDRGGGQGIRQPSGVQRAVQVRRARAAGPCHAGALRRLLGCQEHPLRQGRVSGVRGFIGAARQPEGRHHRPRRVHRADRCRRGEGGSEAASSSCRTRSAISASPTTSTTARGRTRRTARMRWCARRSTRRSIVRRWSMWCSTACTRRRVQAVPPSSPFYDEALKAPPRDVAKAKALLQAGRRRRCR